MKRTITYFKKLTFFFLLLPIASIAQWTPVNSNVTEDLNDVFFFNNTIGFCGGNNGTLLKSIDAGQNWSAKNLPTTDDIVKVHFITEDIGFIQAYNFGSGFSTNTIYRSIDGGNSWSSIMDSFPIPQINNQNLHVRNADYYFNGKYGVINFLYSDNPQTAAPTKESWKTSDYGESWVKLDSNISGQHLPAPVIILDSLNWFCGTSNLLRTIDGGITWEESMSVSFAGFPVYNYDSWHIHDISGKGVAVAAYHHDITKFHSFDSLAQNAFDSTNWNGSYYINKMEYIDSLGFFLFGPDNDGNAYIKRTLNDGSFFLQQIDTLQDIYDIAFQDINNGWACGKNGSIYKTVSGGGTVNLEELETTKTDFIVYPNPSKGVLNIKMLSNQKIIGISLYNIKGKLIKRYNISEKSINIKDISTGLYYLNIETPEGSIAKKVIIN
jgi:photosystem II stability/assembly factor-like uncharacterized protein